MDNFNYKKYLAEGRIHLSENASLDVNVNEEEDEVEVTYNGESYKSALGDELLFIHSFGDGEYHSENDAPEIFKYLKEKGGELEVDDDEATLTIKMSDLAESVNESLPDNITSVIDDMTITMGEDAFIAAIFKALSLEDAKKVLRVITKDNPIENVLGPVTYDWLNEGKLLKEDLTITGEYEGEPVINSGDELEEYLIDIMPQAIGAKDFVRKVAFGLTDETSSLSLEDQRKLIQFYLDNKQHFGSQGKSSPLPSSDYDKVVDGLRARKIPSRVKLEDSGRINIELGFDFPDSLAGKVFDMLDELGVEADIMAETSAKGIKSERINGGPRRDYRREDRDDGDGQDEEWYA